MSEPVLTEAELEELRVLVRERANKSWVSLKPEQLAALVAGYHQPAPGAVPWPHHFPLEA